MNQTEIYLALFLSPVLLLAACSVFYWIIEQLDRAESNSAK